MYSQSSNEQFGYESSYDCTPDTLVVGRIKGKNILVRKSVVYLPPGAKIVKLEDPRPGDSRPEIDENPVLRPGSHVELQLGIYKLSSSLHVVNNGMEAMINGRRMPVKAALISLMQEHGLTQGGARGVLKQAQQSGGLKARIKYAQPYPLQQNVPQAPPFPGPVQSAGNDMNPNLPT
ncbi:unnamed protein product, partial [marine sediment metagenome]